MARHTQRFLKSIAHLDRTTCEVCEKENTECDLDRRLPLFMGGGDYVSSNVHYLCITCHKEKSKLEMYIRAGSEGNPFWEDLYNAWYDLAYPPTTPTMALCYHVWKFSTDEQLDLMTRTCRVWSKPWNDITLQEMLRLLMYMKAADSDENVIAA